MNSLQKTRVFCPTLIRCANLSNVQWGGELGAGAGRGGGGGGSIREAGGAFGRLEAAHEEEYFYKKQQEQIRMLRDKQISATDYHLKQIAEHETAIGRHREHLQKLR